MAKKVDFQALLEETYEVLKQPPENYANLRENLEFFLNIGKQPREKVYQKICEEVECNRKFPTLPVANLVKDKFRLEYELGMYEKSGLTMLESQGLTFRHQALLQYQRRLKSDDETESDSLLKMQHDLLDFSSNTKIEEVIQTLPKTWRVVQINIDDNQSRSRLKKTPGDQAIDKNFSLKIVTIDNGHVSIYEIPGLPNVDKMPSVQEELQDILKTHLLMYKSDFDKAKYAKVRSEVDDRLEQLILDIENRWLGFFKVLFLGQSSNDVLIQKVVNDIERKFFKNDDTFRSSGRKQLLHKIIDGYFCLSGDQMSKGIQYVSKRPNSVELVELIHHQVAKLPEVKAKRGALVLILDKEIQGLPWESMPCLLGQPVSRVPSVHTLALLHKTHLLSESSVPRTGIRQDKIFYVLNPDQNLAKTQAKLEPALASLSLREGLIGQQPSLPQMKQVLSSMDAFMYCGHGSRLKHFSTQEIEKLNIRYCKFLVILQSMY